MSTNPKREEAATVKALQRAGARRLRDAEIKRLYEAEMRGERPLLSARAYHEDGVAENFRPSLHVAPEQT